MGSSWEGLVARKAEDQAAAACWHARTRLVVASVERRTGVLRIDRQHWWVVEADSGEGTWVQCMNSRHPSIDRCRDVRAGEERWSAAVPLIEVYLLETRDSGDGSRIAATRRDVEVFAAVSADCY